MRLTVAAIGKLSRGPEKALCDKLQERGEALARQTRLGPVEMREIDPKGAMGDKAAEAALLRGALEGCDHLVALDERGKSLGSAAFAERLTRWRDDGARRVGFVIGGADGLASDLRAQADLQLSFGALTWPHAMARAMLLEQLYRAATIAAGHPYHREG